MTKLVGSHYFQVRAFRGAHGPFFVVVEVCVARYSGGTREKGVCESSTSSVERATVSVVVALEVDDDICVTAGNLPEPQRRDAAPLIEGVDEGPPMLALRQWVRPRVPNHLPRYFSFWPF